MRSSVRPVLAGAIAVAAMGTMASSAVVVKPAWSSPFSEGVSAPRRIKRRSAGVKHPSYDPLPPRALQVPFANRPKFDPVERNRAAAKRARKARRVTRHSR